MVRLNLGCGNKILPGWVNVDVASKRQPPDVIADVTKPLPFADNHADAIQAIHLIEHMNRWDVHDILTDWFRVLKPGGQLVLDMPCLDKIMRMYAHCLIDGKTLDWRLCVMGLFGDPRHCDELMMHRWCYSTAEIKQTLKLVGFEKIEISEPTTHIPLRDMRVTGWRPTTPG
jgi:ubiquinone/menaquinone biosynthesis C-methylase UbiE